MKFAAVEQVPLVIVATNNHYAYSTRTTANSVPRPCRSRDRLWFEGYSLDGNGSQWCLEVIGARLNVRGRTSAAVGCRFRACDFGTANTTSQLRDGGDQARTICTRLFEWSAEQNDR